MQLTYRGNTYNMTAPIQSDSVIKNQPKIKLTYRGQQYDYTPPIEQCSTVLSVSQVAALTYRGNTYQHPLPSVNFTPVT